MEKAPIAIALWECGRTYTVPQHKIQKYLDKIIKWGNVCKIKLNPLKINVLNFNFHKKRHPTIDCSIKMTID